MDIISRIWFPSGRHTSDFSFWSMLSSQLSDTGAMHWCTRIRTVYEITVWRNAPKETLFAWRPWPHC